MNGVKWLILACLAAAAAKGAQDAPVIRVDTRLVQVDVTVRNNKGPVSGLTQDDFTLFERGKQQKIALFRVTEAHGPHEADQRLPPGTVSNRVKRSGSDRGEAPGNVTVILVDRLNTPPLVQPYADRELVRYLQSAQQGDQIAIYVLGQQIGVVQDFTTDLDRLIRVASRINIERPIDLKLPELRTELAAAGQNTKAVDEMSKLVIIDNVARTTQALSAIAKHLAGVPGRKNLVWISASFPLVIADAHYRRDFTSEVQKATRMLNEANVAVYPVDARGLTGRGLTIGNIDTLNTVAAETGGQAFYATNDLKGAIRQAVSDSEITYTLGFYVQQDALDGNFHDLRVKVAKSGLDVRYRKGYFASAEAAPTEKQRSDALQELFGSPLDATAVGITALAEKYTAQPGIYRLTLSVAASDLHLQRLDSSWVGSIAVGFSVESAKSPSYGVATFPIHLTEDQLKVALEQGIGVQKLIDTRGVTGRLRVAVQDQTTGSAGSVWVPLGTK